MPTDKPRVTITLTEEELKRIEAYRFNTKQKNQTQAILSLVKLGLEDYIATSPGPEEPRDEEEAVIMKYVSGLTADQQELVFALLQVMIEQNKRNSFSAQAKADE